MIVIVNYDVGNLGSIQNMLKKIGSPAVISRDPGDIRKADKLILPGVGAFDPGMKKLLSFGLDSILKERVIDAKVPILGICLGFQLLTKSSEEGVVPGLGWFDAKTVKFDIPSDQPHLKIPHMGWNYPQVIRPGSLFQDLGKDPRFYFVHSYCVKSNNSSLITTQTNHGTRFDSSLEKDHILGVQFHPEKSHRFGMKLLQNFVERT